MHQVGAGIRTGIRNCLRTNTHIPANLRTIGSAPSMPKRSLGNSWEDNLRKAIKQEFGYGWSIRDLRGKIRLERNRDGIRGSATTNIDWEPSSHSTLLQAIKRLTVLMDPDGMGMSLRQAWQRYATETADLDPDAPPRASMNWDFAMDEYLRRLADLGAAHSTKSLVKSRLAKVVEMMSSAAPPLNARQLYSRIAETCFAKCPPGGNGRKRFYGDIAKWLNWCIDDQLWLNEAWRPLKGEALVALLNKPVANAIAKATDDENGKIKPALKPDDFKELLDALWADGRKETWLVVAIVGLWGLRPHELESAASVGDGLHITAIKRKRNSFKVGFHKESLRRKIPAVPIAGREELAGQVLAYWTSGEIKFPAALQQAIDRYKSDGTRVAEGSLRRIGQEFGKLLNGQTEKNGFAPWWAIKRRYAANGTPGLTPYSLRHSYAYRCRWSGRQRIDVMVAARWMGHTEIEHLRTYARWFPDEMSDQQHAAAFGPLQLKKTSDIQPSSIA